MCKICLCAILQNHTTQNADRAKPHHVHLFFNLF